MPAVDLSQLPEPAIIAEPDFEAILADTKAMMIAAYPAEQREVVSAALELESEPLNVIAQTMSFREMLLRQRVNEAARACMLSHSAGTDLDNLAGNMNTKRLVITPATDTTDVVMENDTSLRLRAQRAYDGLSVAGPSGAYEYFARSASGLVRDARAISPSPANVTVSILSTEGDGTATEALLNTVRAVLNAEDTRPVHLLPYLAWAFSVDRWDRNWPEETKRQVIRDAWLIHRHKGTISALRRAIEPLGYLIRVSEWWEFNGEPGTFKIDVGTLDSGVTEEMYLEMERLIADARPVSRHMTGLNIIQEIQGDIFAAAATYDGEVITIYPDD